MRSRSVLAISCLAGLVICRPAASEESVDYLRDVKPILSKRCYACHGPLKQEAGLRLDSAELIHQGSEFGAVIEPGDISGSTIVGMLTGEAGQRMPPEGEGTAVSNHEIAVIKDWIKQGAPRPEREEVLDPRHHWSYQPPLAPAVPTVAGAGWIRNPLDAFVVAKHEQLGLRPSLPMDKSRLLRRVYIDLIGLPPTPAQLRSFLADPSDQAYERAVDALLASPQYGERWGRHWMDIWRYSDWYGQRQFNLLWFGQRNLWQWRDWIVESLNEDKGYDRMIVEMLAADEAAPDHAEALRATGFLGRNYSAQSRNAWLQHTVEFTSQGLLALTMKCARCHDHKYDPISQQDYYQFRAIFEPHAVRTTKAGSLSGISRVYDAFLQRPTYVLLRGDENNPLEENPLSSGVPPSLGGELEVEEVPFTLETYYPALQSAAQAAELQRLEQQVQQATNAADKAADKGGSAGPAKLRLAMAVAELQSFKTRLAAERAKYGGVQQDEFRALARVANEADRRAIYYRAAVNAEDAEQRCEEAKENLRQSADNAKLKLRADNAERKLNEARQQLASAKTALSREPAEEYSPLGRIYPQTSTGRRLALARWMVDPRNPRTSRVAVNHIWLRHFGTALVGTVDNFGPSGQPPTHPALLDWLAVAFADQRWSMKWLHRLIVTSSTYRMQSSNGSGQDANLRIDPENKFLWRMNPRRMEAEVVRDSLLHLAGRLELTLGGPELDPADADSSRRRSIYFRTTPNHKSEFLDVFDFANPNQCYQRETSVLPQQAFALRNSDLAVSMARVIARAIAESGAAEANRSFVWAAFQLTLCRDSRSEESAACVRFLDSQLAMLRDTGGLTEDASSEARSVAPATDPAMRARENLIRVLLNHNDYVTVR